MFIIDIKDFGGFLDHVSDLKSSKKEVILYRGQNNNHKLLPAIARNNSKINTLEIEKEMLNELKRRLPHVINISNLTDAWDTLVYAQHFGLKTRLLDWTTNPLVALWFACQKHTSLDSDIYIYVFEEAEKFLLDREKFKNPFGIRTTKVFMPTLNNERIIAQSGWFTAHPYSRSSDKFVNLATNRVIKDRVSCLRIRQREKSDILLKLDVFGINHQSLFPDVTGACKQLNWEFLDGN